MKISTRVAGMFLCAALTLASTSLCIASVRGFLSTQAGVPAPETVSESAAEIVEQADRAMIAPPAGGPTISGATDEAGSQEEADDDDDDGDTRCLHKFTETWVGYECRLTDYAPDYFPGDEVKITASFNKSVGSQFGMDVKGSWYTVPGDGKVLETTITPDGDYLNVQITDLKEKGWVNLKEITVEITKKGNEANGDYLHQFLGLWQGFETKFSDYNPDYAPGDEVKVHVAYNRDAESQLGMNVNGEWNSQVYDGKEVTVTVLPDNDYLNIQITDMKGSYTIGIVSIDVEITKKGEGAALGGGSGNMLPTKYKEPGDYHLFSGEVNEGYETYDAWILECADTDWLTLTYDCGAKGQENWGVLGWGATVDGEWKNGPGYSADTTDSTRVNTTAFSVKYLRKMFGITPETNMSYLSLGAWSEGRIQELTLHVGSEILRSEHLFSDGDPDESWVCQDIEYLLDLPDDKYINVQYTCADYDYGGWTVLGWGASVDGEWRDGISYKVSTTEPTRYHVESMSMKAFRDMLHLGWDHRVDSIKLSAFNRGRILDIWISDNKTADPGNPRKDKIVKEPSYSSSNEGTYDEITDKDGEEYEQGEEGNLTEPWESFQPSGMSAIMKALRRGTFLIVAYESEAGEVPSLYIKMKDKTDGGVDASWSDRTRALFSYEAIQNAFEGYLIPQDMESLAIKTANSPMKVTSIKVVKHDAELEKEPIAVLTESWSGFATKVSKWHSEYQVGDTITVTATFDKRVSASIAYNDENGNWVGGTYSGEKTITRTFRPGSDYMNIQVGELGERISYAIIQDIQVSIAGKTNYGEAVVEEGEKAAALADSKKDTAKAAGLTDEAIAAGTKLVITSRFEVLNEEEKLAVDAKLQADTNLAGKAQVAEDCVDIALKLAAEGEEALISSTPEKLRFKIPAPDGIDSAENDFAVVRLHQDTVTILQDLDDDLDTITFASDKFSIFAVVYGPTGTFNFGDTSIHTFRSAWSGYETAISTWNSNYEVGDTVEITLTFNKDTSSQIVAGGDWDHPVKAEGKTLTALVTPTEDNINVQICDMKGELAVKLESIAVKVTAKYDDGTALYVFRGEWTGPERNFADYCNIPYQKNKDTAVTLTFDRPVKSQIIWNWGTGDAGKEEMQEAALTQSFVVTPDSDTFTIQLTSLNGYPAAKLLAIEVVQEVSDSTVTMTRDSGDLELVLTEYNADYQAGDEVTVTVRLSVAPAPSWFSGRIGGNVLTEAGSEWNQADFGVGTAQAEVSWTAKPDGNPSISIWGWDSMDPAAVVTVEAIEVEIVGVEVPEAVTMTRDSGDLELVLTEYNADYQAGDEVTVTVRLSAAPAPGWFSGRIGGNVLTEGGSEWNQADFGVGTAQAEVSWTAKPDGNPSISIWSWDSMDPSAVVTVEAIEVEIVGGEVPEAVTMTRDSGDLELVLTEYNADYQAGDEVTVTVRLSAAPAPSWFSGRIGGNVLTEGGSEWNQADFGVGTAQAEVSWTAKPDGNPSISIWSWDSMDPSAVVTVEAIEVEIVEVEVPEAVTMTRDSGDLELVLTEYNADYQAGDEVTVTVRLSAAPAPSWFSGRIGGNVLTEGGSEWNQADFGVGTAKAEVSWTAKPDGNPSISIWSWDSMDPAAVVTVEAIEVEIVDALPSILPLDSLDGEYTFRQPETYTVDLSDYYDGAIEGEEVTITMQMCSDGDFRGRLKACSDSEGEELGISEEEAFESGEDYVAYVIWTMPLTTNLMDVILEEMDGEVVILMSVEVEAEDIGGGSLDEIPGAAVEEDTGKGELTENIGSDETLDTDSEKSEESGDMVGSEETGSDTTTGGSEETGSDATTDGSEETGSDSNTGDSEETGSDSTTGGSGETGSDSTTGGSEETGSNSTTGGSEETGSDSTTGGSEETGSDSTTGGSGETGSDTTTDGSEETEEDDITEDTADPDKADNSSADQANEENSGEKTDSQDSAPSGGDNMPADLPSANSGDIGRESSKSSASKSEDDKDA